jgi:predicted DNA-binding protein
MAEKEKPKQPRAFRISDIHKETVDLLSAVTARTEGSLVEEAIEMLYRHYVNLNPNLRNAIAQLRSTRGIK